MIPIVAIGASAGGLEQISQLLREMPDDTGAAFVVLQHLDPNHESQLPDLLGHGCAMPVVTIENHMPALRDRVHVIPPGYGLGLDGSNFRLTRNTHHEKVPTVIDRFFRALAAECHGAAIGIILSGTGSDGALGLKAIKAAGGLALVQDPDSAEHDGMPRTAIEVANVDRVGPTSELLEPLTNYLRLNLVPASAHATATDTTDTSDDAARQHGEQEVVSDTQLDTVLDILRNHNSHDSFTTYKPNMLKRRIQRRMGLNGIKDTAAYGQLLEDSRQERTRLARDFLIRVTDFFREPATYDQLREHAIRPLLKDRDVSQPIRVWVPGCATGEEAYSIAIMLAQEIHASGKDHHFILFASDIDQGALASARAGLYPESIESDVSEEALRAFFDRVDSHYQVKRFLRERVVFASQNVIEDPPYSRLDLISCRHLLMYLKSDTQQRVVAMFHFALKNDGFLFLGNSETIGEQVDLFEPVLKEGRLFKRIGPNKLSRIHVPSAYRAGSELAGASSDDSENTRRPDNVEQITRDILLRDYVPAAVLINRKYEIVCSYGPTRDYLSLPLGGSSLGLIAMAHDELRSHVRAVTHRAYRDGETSEVTASLQGRPDHTLKISARPLTFPEPARGLILVTFEQAPRAVQAERQDLSESAVNQQLADELESTRSELQSTIQALEASNEDLKGSNEEILSMNEELQSTNEELETSKEEMQSLNEELTTVNGELESKLAELETAHNDLNNLFSGTQVATLFLDRTMCIKRFTPAIKDLLSLIRSDVGRPLSDITLKFTDPDLEADAEAAIEQLESREKEVQAHNGQWYLRRALPYRTRGNAINGVVVTFADISDLKRASLATHASEQRLDLAMSAINGGMWEMRIDPEHPGHLPDAIYLSARLKRLLGFDDDELADSLNAWQERILPEDRAAFADIAHRQHGEHAEGLHYRIRHRDGSLRWFASYGTMLRSVDDQSMLWIGIDCDITDHLHSHVQAQRVQQVQAQLRLLADALPILIMFVDRERRVQFTNMAYNEWFEVDPEAVVGRSVAEALSDAAHASVEPCVESALAGKAVSCDLETTHHRHGTRTLQIDYIPHAANGEVLGFYALMSNTTNHRRRKADQLDQQSNLVYVQRMATIGEMASTLAHDLSQPLSAINTYAGALTRMVHAGKPAEETAPLLRKIADQVERASGIINQTREFVGRADRGQEEIDVNALLYNAIALMESRARKLNVDMRIDVHTALPAVNGYAVQIEQILVNIIGNALDAMEDIDKDKRILWLATSHTDTGHVRVTITDSGHGIDPGKVAMVFESFHTTKLEGMGMGMGLAISRSIAQWHGGQLWAESQPGHGASFFLKLPTAQPDAPQTTDASDAGPDHNR